ncbi:MAG: glutamate 5-kinase [Alphaproteobacteria bacterium]|nr:glutamate 5-kinase [Alphaproteobacteria bacterium]
MPTGLRVVVKLGTQVVSRAPGSGRSGPQGTDGMLALGPLGSLVEQVHGLLAAGHEVILVSSGAVGLGAARLGLGRPTSLADRQAAAAVGQGVLMAFYDALFTRVGRTVAQVLLTEDDFHRRSHYLDLSQAFERLLALGVVPIVNQNDVVSTKELALTGRVFGDNDRLAALVASNLGADVLLLLSNVDGLHTAPPGTPGATRIARFDASASYAIGEASALGTGGMGSKVEAARVAARSGVRVVIAHGHGPDVLRAAVDGDDVGTTFPPEAAMSRRRQWIAFATAPVGRLDVNDGARRALVDGEASLLWPGLVGVDGKFAEGDIVAIACDGTPIARGRARRGSDALREGIGSGRGVIVHRDDMVLEDP